MLNDFRIIYLKNLGLGKIWEFIISSLLSETELSLFTHLARHEGICKQKEKKMLIESLEIKHDKKYVTIFIIFCKYTNKRINKQWRSNGVSCLFVLILIQIFKLKYEIVK